jgi:CheY-like chemotaxis protein
MARTGIYALIDEIKNAASPDDASGRIDPFVVDLEEDAMGQLPILVVDDEEAILRALTEFLWTEGYLSAAAISGDVALILLQQGIPFGLLITDVILPGVLDGFTLARRARLFYPGIPIIYTTGHPEVAHVLARGAPFGEILAKPYSVETLLRTVSTVLQDRHEPAVRVISSSGAATLGGSLEPFSDRRGALFFPTLSGATLITKDATCPRPQRVG